MFCNNCGSNNPDNASVCSNCGTPLNVTHVINHNATVQQAPSSGSNKDYLTANIVLLVTSLVCAGGCIGMILSIIGIVFGSQAKSAFAVGDYVTGEAKAKIAKIMMIVTIVMVVIGLITTAVILLLYGTAIFAIIAEEMNLALML